MLTKKSIKTVTKYNCDICEYKCYWECDYNKHILTAKHKMRTNANIKVNKVYLCACGKEYKQAT